MKNRREILLLCLGVCMAAGTFSGCLQQKAGEKNEPSTTTSPSETIPPFEELVSYFDYDASAPLDVKESYPDMSRKIWFSKVTGGIKIADVSYNAGSAVAKAYLVVPPGKGPFPAIIYLPPASMTSTRDSFMEEALGIAQKGVVSLHIDNVILKGCLNQQSSDTAYVNTVLKIRRGIDFLASKPEVDASRIGFVGSNAGAEIGGNVSGVEKRIKAYVLMSGKGRTSELVTLNCGPSEHFFGVYYVGHATPASLFFQCDTRDYGEVGSTRGETEFYKVASEPKILKWYAAETSGLWVGPACSGEEATKDRIEWLLQQLGVNPI